jgi:uncharacterized protein (DUF433 family)
MEASRREPHSHIDDSVPRPVVAGTNIKVSQIASEVERLGMTPDEVVEAHPHLTLADVHAALSFYYDHPEAIRGEWREAAQLITKLQKRYPGHAGGRAAS